MDNSDFESESYEVEGSEEIYNKAGNAVCTNQGSRMVLRVVNHDTITRLAFDEKQKQPFGDVLTKRYSKNMQKINRRTPMSKCDFNKVALSTLLRSYFGMGILLYFYCIFSEHLFVSTPLEGYFRKNVSGQDSYS